MTDKEKNLYRAAGLTFNVGKNEIIVIPPKDKFDIENPGKSIDISKMIEELEYLIGFVEKIVIKLSNKNLIPKGQVRELLLELTTLGH